MQESAVQRLLEGYARFRAEEFPLRKKLYRTLAERQNPEYLFITCSDSRIVPELMFQTEPGDLFVIRNAGNIVPPHGELYGGVSATIEYAVKVLGVRHIILCGHSDCGAAGAVYRNRDLSALPNVGRWLRYVEPARALAKPVPDSADDLARFKEFICANVRRQVENLKTHPEVAEGLASGALDVHGWFYEIHTGVIEEVNPNTGEHVPIISEVLCVEG